MGATVIVVASQGAMRGFGFEAADVLWLRDTLMHMSTSISILVVEDDAAVAQGLIAGLTCEGFAVKWCASGAEGLAAAQDWRPRLVILDVRLPDMSGFDVCREFRRRGLRMPVLMLTAQSDEIDRVVGLEAGADDYLAKPYSLRELVARVRAQLRRAYGEFASADADVLYAGDITIDRSRATAMRAGRILNLTPIEFRLLVFLARHPGQAFTRGQLLENVWGHDVEHEGERTVTVHVRRLREKVESDPSDPTLILTVPGIGYRLAD